MSRHGRTARVCWLVALLCLCQLLPFLAQAQDNLPGASGMDDPLFQVEEDKLSDSELNDLLYELSQETGEVSGFLVLPEDYSPPVTGLAGVYHLLLIGVDTAGQGIRGRSDTMVLAVINTRQRTVRLVSFMRDLYVSIPGRGHNRLNAAHVYGGPQLLVRALQANFQVPVDGYLAVDFTLMAQLVDALGGIWLDVREEELSPLNGILAYYNYLQEVPEEEGLLAAAGEQLLLSGPQAMAYARIRKIDSDFERVKRQQRVLQAIFERMMDLDATELASIIGVYAPQVRTDLSLSDALALVPVALSLKDSQVEALTVPVKAAFKHVYRNKTAYLLPNLPRNIRAIQDFLSQNSGR